MSTFIEDYLKYSRSNPGPELWHKFSCLGLISALAERRTWLPFSGSRTWPNLFVFIVGRAGSGKSRIVTKAHDLVVAYNSQKFQSNKIILASDKVNGATFIEELIASYNPTKNQSALFMLQEEMGVSFQDFGAVTFLTDLLKFYDCPSYFSKRIRNQHEEIYNVSVSILAATTKSFLQRYLPSESRGEGLVSRGLFIHVPKLEEEEVFRRRREKKADKSVFYFNKLIDTHIPRLLAMEGPMTETDEAFEYMDYLAKEYGKRQKEVVEGSVMDNYLSRKSMQVIKLAMCLALGEFSMTVEKRHYEEADKWLTMAEPAMNDIFQKEDSKWSRVYSQVIMSAVPVGKANAITVPQLANKLITTGTVFPDSLEELNGKLEILRFSKAIKTIDNQFGGIEKLWKTKKEKDHNPF